MKATFVRSPIHTYSWAVCDSEKALPGSGWSPEGGHARPWEQRDTGGKTSADRQRCGKPRVETEAKTNPGQPQGATGATGPIPPPLPGSLGLARVPFLSLVSNS